VIGPLIEGSTRPIWNFTVIQDDNTAFNLAGATFAGVLYSRPDTRSITLGGSFSITSAAAGTFTYTPVAGDVAEAGEFEIEIAITIGAQPIYVRDHISISERYVS
jgi:hypothetical protein